MQLKFLGAAGSVTGSCILVRTNNSQCLIDCGLQQGKGSERNDTPFPFDIQKIDMVILTHGHLDHTGRVPFLVKNGYRGPIYGHYATCDIARIIWEDIARGDAEQALFDMSDVKTACTLLTPVAYSVPIERKGCTFTLRDAGHILGSSHIELEYESKRVLFSGDIGAAGTPFIRDPYTKWNVPFDAVVIESTYGGRSHKDRNSTVREFETLVKQTIAEKGVMLIPAFAIGRTQDVLYYLNTFVEEKRISPIPVFVDSPMADRITDIYKRNKDCYDAETIEKMRNGDLPLEFSGLIFTAPVAESESIQDVKPPFIVIAGSGMCNGGRILKHLARYAPVKSTTVMFTGWQGAGTPGRAIVDGRRTIEIHGQQIPVWARVATLNGFSAHADQHGLTAWAKTVSGNNKQWYVNHGEPDQASALAKCIEIECSEKAVAVKRGSVVNV